MTLFFKDCWLNREIKRYCIDFRKEKFTLSPYVPFRFMGVFYSVFRKGDHVDYDREIIHDKKGENYALDWVSVHSYYDNK